MGLCAKLGFLNPCEEASTTTEMLVFLTTEGGIYTYKQTPHGLPNTLDDSEVKLNILQVPILSYSVTSLEFVYYYPAEVIQAVLAARLTLTS